MEIGGPPRASDIFHEVVFHAAQENESLKQDTKSVFEILYHSSIERPLDRRSSHLSTSTSASVSVNPSCKAPAPTQRPEIPLQISPLVSDHSCREVRHSVRHKRKENTEIVTFLDLGDFPQTTDGRAGSGSGGGPIDVEILPSVIVLVSKQKSLRTYETVQAPPAMVLWHERHSQIPTALRLTVFLPQKVQMYRECWVISIFFTCLRKEAPYLFEDSSIHRIQF